MELELVRIVPPRRDPRWRLLRVLACALGLLPLLTLAPAPVGARANVSLLTHVTHDVTRELYRQISPIFGAAWKAQTGKQLDAEVVSMNQASR